MGSISIIFGRNFPLWRIQPPAIASNNNKMATKHAQLRAPQVAGKKGKSRRMGTQQQQQ